jgi:hypothetical protein
MRETAAQARERGHEVDLVNWRPLAAVAGGILTAVIMVTLIALAVLGISRDGRDALRSAPTPPPIADGPQLQTAAPLDLAQLRREKNAMLDQYRWLDRDKGVVQIPIERAMELSAARSAGKPQVKP